MKKDIRYLQVKRDIGTFFQLSVKFFIKAGKKTLADKLVNTAFANNFFNNLKINIKTKKKRAGEKDIALLPKSIFKGASPR